MRPGTSIRLGICLIIAGLTGAALLVGEPVVRAHEGEDGHGGEQSELHEQMHQMMDAMMGEGHSEAMHDAMPGSEAMMEACANAMEEDGMSGMGNMMNGTGGMMNGVDDMMGDGN